MCKISVMSFTDIVKELLSEKRMTRQEWGDRRHYVLLRDYILMLHKAGEAEEDLHPWIISESDLVADDWSVL